MHSAFAQHLRVVDLGSLDGSVRVVYGNVDLSGSVSGLSEQH
jgi:hypothetical protein